MKNYVKTIFRGRGGPLVMVTAALLSVAPSPSQVALAQPASAIEQLLENVRYWQARGRPDKAAEAWYKVLRSDPSHVEALGELAEFEARRGRTDEANKLLARLEKVQPSSPRIASLKQSLGLGSKYDVLLAEARNLAKAGKAEEAVAVYRQLWSGDGPTGSIGVEYYQTLGGISGRWGEAKAGLERLVTQNPGDGRATFALARHLTYDESTRREGIARLETMTGGSDGAAALKAWRQGLLWLTTSPADFPIFDRYLKLVPGDSAVQTRIDEARAGIAVRVAAEAGRDRVKTGYDHLEAAELDAAEGVFRKALKQNPRDLDALTGLGNAQLRRELFDEAVKTLTKVKELAPTRREMWQKPLQSALFWESVRRAEALQRAGKPAEAIPVLTEAKAVSPADAHHADLALANIYLDLKQYEDAKRTFESLVEANPAHKEALRGLVELHLRLGDEANALSTNESLAAVAPELALPEAVIRAEILRLAAVAKRDKGAVAEAESLLDAARAYAPERPEVILEQVYTWLELDKAAEARGAMDALRALKVETPEVESADVWVLAAEARYGDALRVLSRIKQPSEALKTASRRLKVQAETQEVLGNARRGKIISAQAALTELQRTARDSPELLGIVANTWADMGRYDEALALMYETLNDTRNESGTLKLQLAAILHKADRENELQAVLRELDAETTLTPRERQGLAGLKIAQAIRRADGAREGGFLARAFNFLQAPLRDHPEDPRLLTALGRLFVSAGEHREAYDLFARVLAVRPENLEARQGALESAVKLGQKERARALAEEGVGMMGDEPRMHLVVGRMHVLLGEDAEAMQAFELAMALEEGRSPPREVGGPAISRLLAGAEKTFGGSPGSRAASEDLSLRGEISREIDSLRARHAIRLGTGFAFRSRPGDPGLSDLTVLSFPTWVSLPTGYRGRLTFTALPVLAEAGDYDAGDARIGPRFGTSGVDLHGLGAGFFAQGRAGIELSLKQEIGAFELEVGSTPLGFDAPTIVGHATYNEMTGAVGVKLDLYRRAVRDSYLAWGGARDLATDVVFGGVTRNGGRLDLGFSIDAITIYLNGGGAALFGDRVEPNWMVEGGAGLQWRLYDWEGTSFTAGLDLNTMFYGQNLRYFTMGQGGYFSPQEFVNFSVPVQWREKTEDVSFDLRIAPGLVWFREEASAFYPTDIARQTLREELLDAAGEPVEAYHPGQTSLAFAFNLDANVEWRVGSGFSLGARFTVVTGAFYQEYNGIAFLGYTFEKKVGRANDMEGFAR